MLTPDFIEKMRVKLLELKASLAEERAGLKPHTEMGNDFDDTAEELQVDEVNQDLIARIDLDLEKIDKALTKIAAGTYGTDDQGREISPERLEVVPYADEAL